MHNSNPSTSRSNYCSYWKVKLHNTAQTHWRLPWSFFRLCLCLYVFMCVCVSGERNNWLYLFQLWKHSLRSSRSGKSQNIFMLRTALRQHCFPLNKLHLRVQGISVEHNFLSAVTLPLISLIKIKTTHNYSNILHPVQYSGHNTTRGKAWGKQSDDTLLWGCGRRHTHSWSQ